jgi:hypothetical protein
VTKLPNKSEIKNFELEKLRAFSGSAILRLELIMLQSKDSSDFLFLKRLLLKIGKNKLDLLMRIGFVSRKVSGFFDSIFSML